MESRDAPEQKGGNFMETFLLWTGVGLGIIAAIVVSAIAYMEDGKADGGFRAGITLIVVLFFAVPIMVVGLFALDFVVRIFIGLLFSDVFVVKYVAGVTIFCFI